METYNKPLEYKQIQPPKTEMMERILFNILQHQNVSTLGWENLISYTAQLTEDYF